MADAARTQIASDIKALHDLSVALNRRNIHVDDFRKLVKSSKEHDLAPDKVVGHFQRALDNLENGFTGVDKSCADVSSNISTLGLSSLLTSLPAPANVNAASDEERFQDSRTLYEELIAAYSAHERYREYCTAAFNALSQHNFRKSQKINIRPEKNAVVMADNYHHLFDRYLRNLSPQLPALTCATYALAGAGTAIEIVVDKIFRVMLVLRGFLVAGVNVRSSEEYFNMEPKSLKSMDLWTPSAYEVYRVLSSNATAGVMHFYNPANPEMTFKSYLQWLNSFASLFSSPCRKCRKYLDQGMPATWRDYRKLEPYHESCRTIAMTPL